MKRLGWKAIGFALWLFGMFQLMTLPLGMMSKANLVEFNFGVILLLFVLGSMIYALVKLIVIAKEYIDYLENKDKE